MSQTRQALRLPVVENAAALRDLLERLSDVAAPARFDETFIEHAFADLSTDGIPELFTRLGLTNDIDVPTDLYAAVRRGRADGKAELAQKIVAAYAPLFGRDPKSHRLEAPELDALVARILGLHAGHPTVVMTRDTFLALVDFATRRNLDSPAGGGRPRFGAKNSLLVFFAKWTSLAIVVLMLGSAYEVLSGLPLAHEQFQSGMGFAYIGAISVIIAFSRGATLREDVQRGTYFTLAGILVWALFDLQQREFEVLTALSGIWYAVFIRRV